MAKNPHPFVLLGRQAQYEQLQAALADAVAGKPRVILLSGSAGTGKTTLLREFCCRAQENSPDLVVGFGLCNSQFGIGDPYLPFKEILALLTGDVQDQLAGRTVNTENAHRLKNITEHTVEALVELGPDLVGVFVPGAGLMLRVGTFIAKKAGWVGQLQDLIDNPPNTQHFEPSQFFEQYTRVIIRLTKDAPLIFVLDDLHWADVGSLELFFHLTRRLQSARDVRLLIIGSYRPDEFPIEPSGDSRYLEKTVDEIRRYWDNSIIDLNSAIGGKNGQAFVNGIIDSEPNQLGKDFRQQLFDHTEGHPLFTVEILRLLQDRGMLAKDENGRWKISEPVTFNELPDTVEAVIRERIAHLTQDLKNILTCGSVEGERFTAEVIARVRQMDELQLSEKLNDELGKQYRLIQEENQAQVSQNRLHLFQFVHMLFQQYIYNNLGGMQRQLLHRAVGEALEALYESSLDQVAAQLSRHFIEAMDSEKAFKYSLMAGNKLRRAYSNQDALLYYLRARDILRHQGIGLWETEYPIARSLAQTYALLGRNAEAQQEIEWMIAQSKTHRDLKSQAESTILLANLNNQVGFYPQAKEAGEIALESAQKAGDPAAIAAARVAIGEACAFLADHEQALAQFKTALELTEQADEKNQAADIIRHMALVYLNRNDYEQALTLAEKALALFHESGDRVGENETLRYIGDIHAGIGDYQQALNTYYEVLRIRREIGQRAREGGALGDMGDIYLFLGFYKASLDLHEQSLAINLEVDYKYGQTWCYHDLGLIHYYLENLETGRAELEKALALAQEIQAQNLVVLSKNDLARLCLDLEGPENLEKGLQLAQEAAELSEKCSLIFGRIVGEAYQSLAYLRLGMQPQALDHSQKAVSLLEAHGPADLVEEEILFIHAQVLSAAGDQPAGSLYLQKAHAEVMRKADKIKDPPLRRSFLRNVAVNRQILQLASSPS